MIRHRAYLDPLQRNTFYAIVAFLHRRLAEKETIDWALKLKLEQRIERFAVDDLLNGPGATELTEPWATAWRLIEESWSSEVSVGEDGSTIYHIQQRLRAGDHSRSVIAAIVRCVAPQIKVRPVNLDGWPLVNIPRHPKILEHLISTSLESGELIDLNVLELASITDTQFLISLASALESAVANGLDIARRLGWDGQTRLWRLGELRRVYYVNAAPRASLNEDPDAYNQGIAPSVKLLCAVVARIAEEDLSLARRFVKRWGIEDASIYLRLWAAMSRNSQLTPIDEVANFLSAVDNDRFWDLHQFPEIAELRAIRFKELDAATQTFILARLQKGPPRNHWPRQADAYQVKKARMHWAVRELKRIEIAGTTLPARSKLWLDARLSQFVDLAGMKIDDGFPMGSRAVYVPPNPDDRYDVLVGLARLHALETALSTSDGGWRDAPSERANDWINQPGNAEIVLNDLETIENGGDDFPRVWNRFGWAHKPREQDDEIRPHENLKADATRVLTLLRQLSDATLSTAVEGICAWLDTWEKLVVSVPSGPLIWLRMWPLAVEVTNRKPEGTDETDLSVTARSADNDRESMDLDTLNTPAGKLVGVFLTACPKLAEDSRAFIDGSTEKWMRDAVIAADGRSGLIATHRLIAELPYFLHADRDWAQTHLIAPLLKDDGASLALWRALARRTHFRPVLEIIGISMSERATDRRLGRDTRRHLVFSLVVESLYAFLETRDPAVPHSRIQQMLRTLEDEVRASAANVIQRFVRELSNTASDGEQPDNENRHRTPSILFHSAAAPFLREVWPQERSLATPGVSRSFAILPAASGEAFAEAVDTISRFLVPFQCWSMLEYDLYGDEGKSKKLAMINDERKAGALMRLLDLTVGTSEGAVIPYDLANALDQIAHTAPSLTDTASFRRLATAARR